jgi:hypothetical protein
MSLDHLEAFFSQENNKPIESIKETQSDQDKPILTASIKIDSKNRELYFKMANSINKSERLRGELTKGIKDHKPVDDLLLIALECISLMIDDKTFYNQNIENLKGRP